MLPALAHLAEKVASGWRSAERGSEKRGSQCTSEVVTWYLERGLCSQLNMLVARLTNGRAAAWRAPQAMRAASSKLVIASETP